MSYLRKFLFSFFSNDRIFVILSLVFSLFSYLEVLSAQEGLLSAQISEATNLYNGARAIIALYIALGGGTK